MTLVESGKGQVRQRRGCHGNMGMVILKERSPSDDRLTFCFRRLHVSQAWAVLIRLSAGTLGRVMMAATHHPAALRGVSVVIRRLVEVYCSVRESYHERSHGTRHRLKFGSQPLREVAAAHKDGRGSRSVS